MRASWPMPRRTSLMSAPSRSHRLAISLMKLILVASMALAAYFVISADSGVITRNGCSVRKNGAYSSRSASATSGLRTPTTTRSGFMKSSIAAPSLRNSGFEATSTCGHPFCASTSATLAFVPTGADGGGEVGGEREPAGLTVVLNQLGEPRLVDRHAAGVEGFDLGGVVV